MADRSSTPLPFSGDFPLKLFTFAFVLSIATTSLTLWQARAMSEQAEDLALRHVQLTTRIGEVMLDDEVLTMSARLCASTSDFGYERRYDEFDLALIADLEAVRSVVPAAEIADLVAQTDTANERLVAIEREAFRLTHAGRGQEALRSLLSDEYARLKAKYAQGMLETTAAADRTFAQEYDRLKGRALWFTAGNLLGIAALLVAWVAALRSARTWIAMRAAAETTRARHLEGISREKDEFLATINHSLKTPLHHVLGFGDLLRTGRVGALSPVQQEFVGNMCDAASTQLSLVNTLIELTQVQSRSEQLDLQPLSPPLLLEALAEEHHAHACAAGVAIKVDPGSVNGKVTLNQTIVLRVLRIFITNACQFTPKGGRVTLAARRMTRPNPATGEDSVYPEGVVFSVTDTGMGITPEVIARLFRPFTQGDGRLARSHQGTGISLTLARKLAEEHGGECSVTSTVDAGSTFSLWVPLQSNAECIP